MKKIKGAVLFLLLMVSVNSFADTLEKERLETINQYLGALQKIDTKLMTSLFTQQGFVISTSKGKVDPMKFFTGFFNELKSTNVKISNLYKDLKYPNHYAAKFKFSWTEKTGASAGGEYIDDFTFADNSNKLLVVNMFENKTGTNNE